MKRKIIQQGPATLMVSLPAKWARKQGWKKGEEVDVEELERSLVIGGRQNRGAEKITINLADYGGIASRAIGALYKQGYDEIEIVFRDAEDIKIVNKNLNEFIGFEIVQQTTKGCTIREISTAKEEEFESILNRLVLLLKSVAEDCHEGLKKNDKGILEMLPERDMTINKYANYCRRILNKYGYKGKKLPQMYYIVEELENLGDEYKHLVERVLDKKLKLGKMELELLSEVNGHLDKLYHLILKFDIAKIEKMYEALSEFSDRMRAAEKTKEADKARVFDTILGMSRIIKNITGPLMTMEL